MTKQPGLKNQPQVSQKDSGYRDDLNRVIRSMLDIPLEKRNKMFLGSIMMHLFKARTKKLETNSVLKSWGAFDRLLRNGILAKAYRTGNHDLQRTMFTQYWAEEADDKPDVWINRFKEEFLGHNVALIDALEKHLEHGNYERICEIGCGHGQVLEYLANRISTIPAFIGMDISKVQIEKNRQIYNHPKISFEADDAFSWIQNEARPRTIFLTNGGVFEYLLQEELEVIFSHIAENLAPAMVGIIENVGSDHDLEKEHNSLTYGRELSFSHNYPYLMKRAGLTVVYQTERKGVEAHGGGRWIRVLGVTE